jgi:hypothetical protein
VLLDGAGRDNQYRPTRRGSCKPGTEVTRHGHLGVDPQEKADDAGRVGDESDNDKGKGEGGVTNGSHSRPYFTACSQLITCITYRIWAGPDAIRHDNFDCIAHQLESSSMQWRTAVASRSHACPPISLLFISICCRDPCLGFTCAQSHRFPIARYRWNDASHDSMQSEATGVLP